MMQDTGGRKIRPTRAPRRAAQPRLIGLRRRTRAALLVTTALQASAMLVLALPARAQPAPNAQPVFSGVSAGSVQVTQSPANTQVTQSSARGAVDWKSFDVGSQQSVTFRQPSATSVTLNRVNSPQPSDIAGKITANGQIIIQNQSGVVFENGANVNAAAVVVSAPGITNDKFMKGTMSFDIPAKPNAAIVNKGTITVGQAGLAALVAPRVVNSGTINARLGTVVLAGAMTHTIDLYGDQLLSIDVTGKVTQAPLGPDGKPVDALVTNTGTIVAAGGTVQLTAQAADGLVTNLVQAGGKISAPTTAGGHTGMVQIDAVGGSVLVDGKIYAQAMAAGTSGGQIEIAGTGAVTLAPTARVKASGPAGGGTIAIGTTLARATGGPSVTPTITAQSTTIQSGAKVSANAKSNGPGGHVTVLSLANTSVAGSISARGGKLGGNGGSVELSGQAGFQLPGGVQVNVGAPAGQAGRILIDPDYLTIVASGGNTPPGTDAQAATGALPYGYAAGQTATVTNSAFSGFIGNVVLQALYDLTVAAPITMTSTGQSLTLQAGRNLTVQTGAPITVDGNIILGAAGTGPSTLASPAPPATSSGALTIGSAVTSNSGSVSLLAGTGGVTIDAPVTAAPGQTISVMGSTITVDATGANTGSLSVAAATSTGAGVTTITPGTIALRADTLAFNATSAGTILVSAPDGTVAIAPYTAGNTMSVDASGAGPSPNNLELTPGLLAHISTLGSSPGTAGTETLALGSVDGGTTLLSGAITLQAGYGAGIDFTQVARTLQLDAAGAVVFFGGAPLTIGALTGHVGAPGSTEEFINIATNLQLGALGNTIARANGPVTDRTSAAYLSGVGDLTGLAVTGDIFLGDTAATLSVVGPVSAGAGRALVLSGPAIVVDGTGAATGGNAGALSVAALFTPPASPGGATQVLPGELELQFNKISILSAGTPIVTAPDGLVELTPANTANPITLDQTTSSAPNTLSLSAATLAGISTLGIGAATAATETLELATLGTLTINTGATAFDLTGVTHTLALQTGGDLTETGNGIFSVPALAGRIGGSLLLNNATSANTITELGSLLTRSAGGVLYTTQPSPSIPTAVFESLVAGGNLLITATGTPGQTLSVLGSVTAGAGQVMELAAPALSVAATGSLNVAATSVSAGGVTTITPGTLELKADAMALAGAVNAPAGAVLIAPLTAGHAISIDATRQTVATDLSLTPADIAEINTITDPTTGNPAIFGAGFTGPAPYGTQMLVLATGTGGAGGTITFNTDISLAGVANTLGLYASGAVNQNAGGLTIQSLIGSAGGSVALGSASNAISLLGTPGTIMFAGNSYTAGYGLTGLTAAGNLAVASSTALDVIAAVSAGAGYTLALTTPALTVDAVNYSGSLSAAALMATSGGVVTVTPGTVALVTDALTLTVPGAADLLVSAPDGTVAIAPYTSGNAILVDASTTPTPSPGTLLLTPTLLAHVSTLGATSGTAGTQTLALGSIDGGTTLRAGSITLNTATAGLDFTQYARTLQLDATGLATATGTGTLTITALTGHVGDLALARAGNAIAELGNTVARANGLVTDQTSATYLASVGDLTGLTAAGGIAVTDTGTLTVVGPVAPGAGNSLALTAPSLTIDATGTNAGALSAAAVYTPVSGVTQVTPGTIVLTTDTLSILTASAPIVTAPDGLIVIAPLTAGRAITLDPTASATPGALSLSAATLAGISTIGTVAGTAGTQTLELATSGPLTINTGTTGFDLTAVTRTLALATGGDVTQTGTGTFKIAALAGTVSGSLLLNDTNAANTIAELGGVATRKSGGTTYTTAAPSAFYEALSATGDLALIDTGTPAQTLSVIGPVSAGAGRTLSLTAPGIVVDATSLASNGVADNLGALRVAAQIPGPTAIGGVTTVLPGRILLTADALAINATTPIVTAPDGLVAITPLTAANISLDQTQGSTPGTLSLTAASLAAINTLGTAAGTFATQTLALTASGAITINTGTAAFDFTTGARTLDLEAGGSVTETGSGIFRTTALAGTIGGSLLLGGGAANTIADLGAVTTRTLSATIYKTDPTTNTTGLSQSLTAGGDLRIIDTATPNQTLTVIAPISAGAGHTVALTAPGLTVDATGFNNGAIAVAAAAAANVVTPGSVLLQTDSIALLGQVDAPAGTVAIAPLTAGHTMSIDATRANTATNLSITTADLAEINTIIDPTTKTIAVFGNGFTGPGPIGTQTLALGSIDGGATRLAGALTINTPTVLTGIANTLGIYAFGNVTQTVGLTVQALTGNAGGAVLLNTTPNTITQLGNVQTTGGFQTASAYVTSGIGDLTGLAAAGDIRIDATAAAALTVVGPVTSGPGATLLLEAHALTVDQTSNTGTVNLGSLVATASTATSGGITTITPGSIELLADAISLQGPIHAPAGTVAIAPLTIGNSITIDATRANTSTNLSITTADLAEINTINAITYPTLSTPLTATTNPTSPQLTTEIAVFGNALAGPGPIGTQTLALGSIDGGATLRAAAITINTPATLTTAANTLALYATGAITQGTNALTVQSLTGHAGGALVLTAPNTVGLLGNIQTTGGFQTASPYVTSGIGDLTSLIAGAALQVTSGSPLDIIGPVAAGAGEILALTAPSLTVDATATATTIHLGSLYATAAVTLADVITPGRILLLADAITLQGPVDAPAGTVAIAPLTAGHTISIDATRADTATNLSLTPTDLAEIDTIYAVTFPSLAAPLTPSTNPSSPQPTTTVAVFGNAFAGPGTIGTQTLALGSIDAGATPQAGAIAINTPAILTGIANTLGLYTTGSVTQTAALTVQALTGNTGGAALLDTVPNSIADLGNVQQRGGFQTASAYITSGIGDLTGLIAAGSLLLDDTGAPSLTVDGPAAAGAGQTLLLKAHALTVDQTASAGTINLGSLAVTPLAATAAGITTITPGVVQLLADAVSLAGPVDAPAGTVAIAPLTAGHTISIDATRANTATNLSLTPTDLAEIDTINAIAYPALSTPLTATTNPTSPQRTTTIAVFGDAFTGPGPIGTQTLALGSIDGGATLQAGGITINTAAVLTGIANTLATYASGSVTQTAALTVQALTGQSGAAISLAATPNTITQLGNVQTTGGFQTASAYVTSGIGDLTGLTAAGNIGIDATGAPALTVRGPVTSGAGATLLLEAHALTVDQTSGTGTVNLGSLVATPLATSAGGVTTVTPGSIDLLTDAIVLAGPVDAPAGTVAIAPLTAGNTITIDATRANTATNLSITTADLAEINTINAITYPALSTPLTAATNPASPQLTTDIAVFGTALAGPGPIGTQTLALGSIDGGATLRAGGVTINTPTTLTPIAATLGLYANGPIAEAGTGALTVTALTGTAGIPIGGTATTRAALTLDGANAIADLGNLHTQGAFTTPGSVAGASGITATGSILLADTQTLTQFANTTIQAGDDPTSAVHTSANNAESLEIDVLRAGASGNLLINGLVQAGSDNSGTSVIAGRVILRAGSDTTPGAVAIAGTVTAEQQVPGSAAPAQPSILISAGYSGSTPNPACATGTCDISIAGLLGAGGSAQATSIDLLAAGRITESGTIRAATLTGASGGYTDLRGASFAANQITTLDAFDTTLAGTPDLVPGATGGFGLVLRDATSLAVAGPLTDHSGSGLSLAINGDLVLQSAVTAEDGGTAKLQATGNIYEQTGGLIAAGLLTGQAGLLPDMESGGIAPGTVPTAAAPLPAISLGSAIFGNANAVTTLGSFTAAQSFELVDAASALTVGGVVLTGAVPTTTPAAPTPVAPIQTAVLPLPAGTTPTAEIVVPNSTLTIAGTIESGFAIAGYSAGNVGLSAGTATTPGSIAVTGAIGAQNGLALLAAGTSGTYTSIAPANTTCGTAGCTITIPGSIAPQAQQSGLNEILLLAAGDGTTQAISETGQLTAASLQGQAGVLPASGNSGTLGTASFTGTNAIATLGPFTSTGALTYDNATALTVASTVSAGAAALATPGVGANTYDLAINVPGNALTVTGTLTDSGASGGNVALTAGSIAIPGSVAVIPGANGGGTLTTTATGAITESGSITAQTLTGTAASAAFTGSGASANTINNLAAFTTSADFSLQNGIGATVTGALTSTAGNATILDHGTLLINAPVSAAANTTLTADAAITTTTTITAGNQTTITAGTGINQTAGAITGNGSGVALTAQSGAIDQSQGATITATSASGAVSLNASADIAFAGTIAAPLANPNGTVSLVAGGNITETNGTHTGLIDANLLTGSAGGNVVLDNTSGGGNQVVTLGNFIAGGSFLFINGRSMNVTGAVTAGSNLTLTDTGTITQLTGSTIQATNGALTLTASGDIDQQVGALMTAPAAAGTLNLTAAGNIEFAGTLAATGPSASMTLNANGGDITDTFQGSHTGRVLATSLFAHALGNIIIDNTAGAGNQIGPIVNVSATNGGVILTNGQNLFFIGPVSAGLDINLASTGNLTLNPGITVASNGGAVSFNVAGQFIESTGVTISGPVFSIVAPGGITIDGTITAPKIVLNAQTGTIAFGNGADLNTGSAFSQNGQIPFASLPSAATANAGAYLFAGAIEQFGALTINGGLVGSPAATLRADITTPAGDISFDPNNGLQARSTTLILNLTGGSATGEAFILGLDLQYSAQGSTDLIGLINQRAGQASAQVGFISPRQNKDYLFNSCPIQAINCLLLSTESVPVINPLQDINVGVLRSSDDDSDLLLPNVAGRDY